MAGKKGLIEIHKGDIRNIIFLYGLGRLKNSVPFYGALVLSILMTAYGFHRSPVDGIEFIVDSGYRIIPAILGLSFAGFGVVLSIGGSSLISEFVDNDVSSLSSDKEIAASTFQVMLAVITWAVLIQSYMLVLIILVDFVLQNQVNLIEFHASTYFFVNIAVLFLMSLIFFYSILQIPQTLLNLFTFGQLTNFVHLVKKIEQENVKAKDKDLT
jgi:hypothetical protein